MNKRCRRELKPTNGSWRVDETYVRVKGKWVYLYRAVDSTGATIDFLLSTHRDAAAAKRFFQRALRAPGHPRPRVIKVGGNPSYPRVEPDHRAIKTASECQPGVGVLPQNPTNNSGLRSGAHDPERPGEVVAQRGCGWSGLVHPRDARVAGLNNSPAPLNRLGSISQPFLQHFRLNRVLGVPSADSVWFNQHFRSFLHRKIHSSRPAYPCRTATITVHFHILGHPRQFKTHSLR